MFCCPMYKPLQLTGLLFERYFGKRNDIILVMKFVTPSQKSLTLMNDRDHSFRSPFKAKYGKLLMLMMITSLLIDC